MDEPPDRALRRSWLLLFLLMVLVYGTSPVVTNWDSYLSVPTAYSLVNHGDIDLDEYTEAPVREHYGYYRAGGRHYEFYGWPTALFAVPAVLATEAAGLVGIGSGTRALIAEDRMAWMQLASASVLAAAVVVLVAVAVYGQLDLPPGRRRRRVATGVALAAGLATPLWSTASRALWQHGPSMAALALAVICGARLVGSADERRRARASTAVGIAVAAAYAIRPTNIVALLAFSTWIALKHRRLLTRYLSGLAAVTIPFVVVNLVTYGTAVPPSHLPAGRTGNDRYLEALAANLISPNRGLLLFTPVVLVAVAGLAIRHRSRRLRPFDVTLAATCLGHWLVVSATAGWWGGHAYGPRYMSDIVPLLPYLSVPAVSVLVNGRTPTNGPTTSLRRRLVAGGVGAALAWSVFVHAQGAYLRASACWNTEPVNINQDVSRVWDWGDPQFLRGVRALTELPVGDAVLGACARPPGQSEQADAG